MAASEPITDRRQLVEYLASGCKPRDQWKIGTEHEKFAYDLETLKPLEYEGPRGVRAVLERLQQFGWDLVYEGGNPIALQAEGKGSITLEPGGQLELSGAPLDNIHQTCTEVNTHLKQVKAVAADLNIAFLGLGYNPKIPVADVPWMPKGRYKIMRDYMPTRGGLGLDMMLNTCTVQVNLDFDSEATMARMFRVSLALQPIATALFANSPFKNGKPTGFLSYRSHIWTDVDPDRSGMLPFVFEDGFGFEQYVDYLLDVPMYFVYRDGRYIDAAGQSFRDFMNGRLPALPGEVPTMADWSDHLTVSFPEVRLKKYLEMRGADGGPWGRICALSALWVGLLYDSTALDDAWELIKDWTVEDQAYLRDETPKQALKTPFGNRSVKEIAIDMLKISHDGLRRRERLDVVGLNETHFLNDLFTIADSGFTAAEELLCAYERRWERQVDPLFQEYAY
ncbi:glutamate--cysteine ligase [Magnetospira sp. QH-2]|uniref:glutamate--cysteine ligase n=1 Tax=Magnetospira sp. (strain QH-2) TaxID=1288970 RepID=UPI0003E80FF0|nr:glutamate--cysteine ligase [Magnetospira sp. QH-2]CCQ74722.1 Glutamate--cysteine ligase [Magnetospira sp. QH-2]